MIHCITVWGDSAVLENMLKAEKREKIRKNQKKMQVSNRSIFILWRVKMGKK